MIVGQDTAIDLRRAQAGRVGGMHAIVDALVRPVRAACHRRFQIDDAQRRLPLLPRGQRGAPDIVETDRLRHGAVDSRGQLHITQRGMHAGLMQDGIAGMRQDLVDAAPGHHIAA
jgi:hypothetical protein